MKGIFEWQTGTPVEYGSYLVLHLDAYNRRVIHHDVWFDDRKCWQSQWHNIIAWCKFGDIHIMEEGGKEMKTLDLVLKRKWFEMIASGEKTEEYREIKPYWIVRMMEEVDMDFHAYEKVCHDTALFYGYNEHLLKNALYHGSMKFRDFDKVTFHLGYAKDRPSMTFAIKEIVCDEGREEWGALPGETYFVIKLGE